MISLLPLVVLLVLPGEPRVTHAIVGVCAEAGLVVVFVIVFVSRNGAARIDPPGTRIVRGRTTISSATATSFRAWAPNPTTMLAEVASTDGTAIAFRLSSEKVDLTDAQRWALTSFLLHATLRVPDPSGDPHRRSPRRFDGSYLSRDEAIELIEGERDARSGSS